MQAISNAKVFTGDEVRGATHVFFESGVIKKISKDKALLSDADHVVDFEGDYLVPGLIDLQVNGGGGIMFNSEPTVDTIKTMLAGHKRYGTTGLFPTLITDSFDKMQKAIHAVDEAISNQVPGVLGIHLEGPFLSKAKKGAHDASKFCQIDEEAIELMCSLKHGKTIVTIAPELTDAATINTLRSQGIIVCAGHSNANYQQTMDAIESGLHGFTHLFNAMTPFTSREPGMVGAAISNPNTWFGIIADGHHVHPTSFKLAVNAKQTGGAILVTDAMSTVGAKTTSFVLNGETISSVNGRCVNAAGSLAGSDLNLYSAVVNAAEFASIHHFEALKMASQYPAKAVGLGYGYGWIKEGGPANFLRLSAEFTLKNTWILGSDVNHLYS